MELPDGAGKIVLCAGGRGELDDAAAAMLAQVLTVQGAAASMIEHHAMAPTGIRRLDLSGVHAVVIGFLNAEFRHSRTLHGTPAQAVPNFAAGGSGILDACRRTL